MKKILLVIDMQNDFIDGALGTPEAVAIVDNVKAKIKTYPWPPRRAKIFRSPTASEAPRAGRSAPISRN